MIAHVVGIDPGLVHTGVVRMIFDPYDRVVTVEAEPVVGPNGSAVRGFIDEGSRRLFDNIDRRLLHLRPPVFIEGYRPRSHFDTDARMVKAVHDIKTCVPWSKVLNNTGVKKVVTEDLMRLLGVWRFAAVTHHQDLRSAARIGLLGMYKIPELNRVVADVVADHLAGRPWDVRA